MRRALMLLLLGLTLLAGCRDDQARPLKPGRPSPTPSPLVIDGIPRPVAFPDLGANPRVFINQLIQVTGSYTPLTPAVCDLYKGPLTVWGLVADNLQMGAVGYETVLQLVPPGTSLTVEGFWRFYVGPLGCGKEPPHEGLWYLEVRRIVQPNPLTRATIGGEGAADGLPVPTESVGSLDTPPPANVITPTVEVGNGGVVVSITPPPSATPTPITVVLPSPTGGATLPGTSVPSPTLPAQPTPSTPAPTPTSSPTPAGNLPVVSPSPTTPSLPTLPSGPGTPEPCPYPGDDECKPTSTPYP